MKWKAILAIIRGNAKLAEDVIKLADKTHHVKRFASKGSNRAPHTPTFDPYGGDK